jgi:hypothetical protein
MGVYITAVYIEAESFGSHPEFLLLKLLFHVNSHIRVLYVYVFTYILFVSFYVSDFPSPESCRSYWMFVNLIFHILFRSSASLHNVIVDQPSRNSLAFCRNRMFITVFIIIRPMLLSWATSFIPCLPMKLVSDFCFVFIPCVLLYIYERSTNELIVFKVLCS